MHLDEFLKRTCLTYCEFIDLWKSEFVRFVLRGRLASAVTPVEGFNPAQGFPDCEPCCLEEYVIQFLKILLTRQKR